MNKKIFKFIYYWLPPISLMVTIFMAIYIIQTALALPGAGILSLSAGAVFGPLMGTLYAAEALSQRDKGGRKYNRAFRKGIFK